MNQSARKRNKKKISKSKNILLEKWEKERQTKTTKEKKLDKDETTLYQEYVL